MTDSGERDSGKLSLSRPGKLELKKRVGAGKVRQSFSHGRSKQVTVEVKRKRTIITEKPGKDASQKADGLSSEERAARARALQARPKSQPAPAAAPEPVLETSPLPQESKSPEAVRAEQRARELAELKAADVEEQRKQEAIDARRQEEEEKKRAAEEARREASRRAEPSRGERQPAGPAARRPRPAGRPPARPPEAPGPAVDMPSGRRAGGRDDEDRGGRRRSSDKRPAAQPRRTEPRRRAGKLTIVQALDEEVEQERQRSLASVRRARERERQRQASGQGQQFIQREVIVPETILISELANRMATRAVDVIRVLMQNGIRAVPSQAIDADTAELVVEEFGHKVVRVAESDVEEGLSGSPDDETDLRPRAPVVTVMGHVDHGKTSLLDALRQTDVVASEAGGITQHIGAYRVRTPSGADITFLDTPGHEAFSAMRARGSRVTDIVILVVAADDSVQPQTVEAISHAKAAEAPIIVAINKVDRSEADPQRVRNDLLQHELVAEEFGGDVQMIEVSATAKTGLNTLEEAILLQADLMELRANPVRRASGIVVEAQLDRGRGAVATVLVQNGTLKVGDIVVAGAEWGKIRAMIDDRMGRVKHAGPSVPVEVLGLSGPPVAGDEVVVVDNEARAREVTEYRARRDRESQTGPVRRGSIDDIFKSLAVGKTEKVPLVVKADVQGSVEAIVGALMKLGSDEVQVDVLYSGVGGISESDVTLAYASGGFIIGFNVRAANPVRLAAQQHGVDIRYYSIIYELIDDIREAMTGKLAPELRERQIGQADIREVFNITRVGRVAGCRVIEGVVRRGAGVRLLRDNIVIHEGKLATLKRFKEEQREVREGFECGMSFESYQDIQVGDVIECFETEEVQRTLP
ncbi:MAG: translation initiation factor IF-2 [Alphaproteobacteria bacterium]|nr:translation initiation factor IF-2 [Alphaproteobacteria bacterium]